GANRIAPSRKPLPQLTWIVANTSGSGASRRQLWRRAVLAEPAASAIAYVPLSASSRYRATADHGAAITAITRERTNSGGTNCGTLIGGGCFGSTRIFHQPYWKNWRASAATSWRFWYSDRIRVVKNTRPPALRSR